jgi:hypothetical protein
MFAMGALLIVLAIPLLVGYAIGSKKDQMWRNLGIIMLIIGAIVVSIRQ